VKWIRDRVRNLADGTARLLYDRELPPPTEEEQREIEELRAAARNLPPLPKSAPGEVEDLWIQFLRQFRDKLLHADPRSFTRWQVTGQTMGMSNQTSALIVWDKLRRAPDFHSRWRPILAERGAGRPIRFLLHPETSGLLIWQASHLMEFERHTGRRIDEMDLIFEFGGGYGNLCRLTHRLGFSGRYLIFDLPELLLLQRYFLRSLGLRLISPDQFAAGEHGICQVSEASQLPRLLSRSGTADRSLFVAVLSISEAPMDLRRRILELISGFGAFLIAFSQWFGAVDNIEYFERLTQQFPDVVWRRSPVRNRPRDQYLFGARPASVADSARGPVVPSRAAEDGGSS
jgi:hypothetical protein